MNRIATVALPIVIAAVWTAGAGAEPPADTGTIIVNVRGLENDRGQLLVSLFRDKKGFPDKGEYAEVREAVRIENRQVTLVLRNVRPGPFAIAVLHDEDLDFKMKTGRFGRPKEGYGVSRNPRSRLGPPKYESAQLTLEPGETETVEIRVRY